MIKKSLFFFLLSTIIAASSELDTMYSLYKDKEFKKACFLGLKIFNKHKKNTDFIMLYGLSCLHSDYIDRLAIPLTGLRYSRAERANASYFATILLQKKLLYHALIDNVKISDLNLPKTDYILSKVFDLYVKGEYQKKGKKFYLVSEEDPELTYVLYIDDKSRLKKMVIEQRKDNKTIKTHRYW